VRKLFLSYTAIDKQLRKITPKHDNGGTEGGVEARLHPVTLTLDGHEWSKSRPAALATGKSPGTHFREFRRGMENICCPHWG
jgi:hypothetical protein